MLQVVPLCQEAFRPWKKVLGAYNQEWVNETSHSDDEEGKEKLTLELNYVSFGDNVRTDESYRDENSVISEVAELDWLRFYHYTVGQINCEGATVGTEESGIKKQESERRLLVRNENLSKWRDRGKTLYQHRMSKRHLTQEESSIYHEDTSRGNRLPEVRFCVEGSKHSKQSFERIKQKSSYVGYQSSRRRCFCRLSASKLLLFLLHSTFT